MNLRSRMTVLGLVGLVLGGCPEPDDAAVTPEPAGDGSASGEASGDNNTTNNGSGEPQPFSNPNDARFSVQPDSAVKLSGTFQYDGDVTGSYRIDFQRQEGSAPPMLVHAIELEQPGEFSVDVPKGYGEIQLLGFVDAKSDGPTADDPVGRTREPIIIGEEDITGVVLEVALGNNANVAPPEPGKGPSGGELSNGGAPSDGGEGGSPPPDGPPSDG